MHTMRKEMFEVAESQFRRAAYLNPYEAGFKQHLAWCLYKQGKLTEARKWVVAALRQKPGDPDSGQILLKITEKPGLDSAMPPEFQRPREQRGRMRIAATPDSRQCIYS